MGPVETAIRDKLSTLNPHHLSVTNNSHQHRRPAGSESHFHIVLVTESFQQLSRLDRQRRVHQLLHEELQGPVHALSLRLFSIEEWEKQDPAGVSGPPPCRHR